MPPFAAVSAAASVSVPSLAKLDDAVEPNFAVSAENTVEDACCMFVT